MTRDAEQQLPSLQAVRAMARELTAAMGDAHTYLNRGDGSGHEGEWRFLQDAAAMLRPAIEAIDAERIPVHGLSPHYYVNGGSQVMGDCSVCGYTADAKIHTRRQERLPVTDQEPEATT